MNRQHGSFSRRHDKTLFALLFGLTFSALVAYATPPGSAYTPGETLDPTCAPGDVNCTVDIGNLIGSTSTLGTETWLGTSAAGLGTASSDGTVFIGINAGLNATNAAQSIFLGTDAGNGATNAASSFFIGQDSGNGATDVIGSFFAGQEAGIGATDAIDSVFLGTQAGDTAINAAHSSFIGEYAGRNATNASNSIFMGFHSGNNNTTLDNTGSSDNFSILLGPNTSTGGFSNSIAIGSGATNTATNQFMIGSATREINEVMIFGANAYLNFEPGGFVHGVSGYGFRDNAGTMQFKNFGGSWTSIPTSVSYTFSTGLTNASGIITNDLSTGKGSAQTVYGATTAGGVLSLSSTSHATKGNIVMGSGFNLDETNGWLNLGAGSPTTTLTVNGSIAQYGGSVSFDLTGGTADFLVKSASFTGGLLSLEDNGDFFIGDGTNAGSVSIQGSVNTTGTLQYEAFAGHNFIGPVQFSDYGAGTALFDASGNITSSSDERLKDIQGDYTPGLAAVLALNPIMYKWNALSGLETEHTYAGFSAQNVQANIPYGTGENSKGYLSLQDRAILATTVNAIKEIDLKMISINDMDTENSWRDSLIAWFANAGNHITRIFTGEICLTDPDGTSECLNKTELGQLKQLLHPVVEPQDDGDETPPDDTGDTPPDETPPKDEPPTPPEDTPPPTDISPETVVQ